MSSLNGLKAFLQKYDDVVQSRKDNNDLCAAEFQVIKIQSSEDKKELSASEGAKDTNKKKNRYKDILPYDHTRVILHSDSHSKFSEGSDYINANYIEDASGKRSYIAAQGPMPHTVDDFWRLIWQFKVEVVIMGCKEVEMGRNRCHRYWPEGNEEMWFHDIKVTLIGTKQYAHNMVLRKLRAEKNGNGYTLSQLHYMDWPDHGAPETSETILQLIQVLREKQPSDDPPVLIHCSAGCGRTGAIIAVDCGRKLISAHAADIDVLAIVSRLRKQRPALVQSKEQYEFIYQVFNEMVQREIKLYEEQYNTDYMNINSIPVKKEPTYRQQPAPLPSSNPPLHGRQGSFTSLLTTDSKDLKPQLVLPREHLVNTDGSGIRRTRSAYMKKTNPNVPKISIPALYSVSPEPDIPASGELLLLKNSPTLPPKSPPILPPKSPSVRQKDFSPLLNERKGTGSVKPPVKPPYVTKRHSHESLGAERSKSEGDYMQLEARPMSGIVPEEDFIPPPTPVGFTQYPMPTKMSYASVSHSNVPLKPSLGGVDKPLVVAPQVHTTDLGAVSHPPRGDEYAVVDKSKKPRELRDDCTSIDTTKALYENIPHGEANRQRVAGKEVTVPVIKPYTVTDVGIAHWKKKDQEAQSAKHPPLKPMPSKEKIGIIPLAMAQREPQPLQIQRTSIPSSDDWVSAAADPYSELIAPAGGGNIEKQNSPTTGKKWFNEKMKNLGKRVSVPTNISNITSSIVPSIMSPPAVLSNETVPLKYPFSDVNDKYAFPNQLLVKPIGPREPPAAWKMPIL